MADVLYALLCVGLLEAWADPEQHSNLVGVDRFQTSVLTSPFNRLGDIRHSATACSVAMCGIDNDPTVHQAVILAAGGPCPLSRTTPSAPAQLPADGDGVLPALWTVNYGTWAGKIRPIVEQVGVESTITLFSTVDDSMVVVSPSDPPSLVIPNERTDPPDVIWADLQISSAGNTNVGKAVFLGDVAVDQLIVGLTRISPSEVSLGALRFVVVMPDGIVARSVDGTTIASATVDATASRILGPPITGPVVALEEVSQAGCLLAKAGRADGRFLSISAALLNPNMRPLDPATCREVSP